MGLIYQRPWTRQPPASRINRDPLNHHVQLALSGGGPDLKTNSASKVVTPYGIGLASGADNVCQFPRNLAIQNADTVTVQALLYASVPPDGSASTRIFGTRGTTEGDGNRRGWEVSVDGGSSVDARIQIFDSSGVRSNDGVIGALTGASVVGQLLWVVFQVVRVPATSTSLTAWFRLHGSDEAATGTATLGTAFGDDTPLVNFPEVCGLVAGSGANQADYAVLQILARTGMISAAERAQWYQNPWRPFAPLPRMLWAPASSAYPVLSAATVTSVTSTTATPRVTVTF